MSDPWQKKVVVNPGSFRSCTAAFYPPFGDNHKRHCAIFVERVCKALDWHSAKQLFLMSHASHTGLAIS